ncbi:hypothetical protein EG328_000160 [Venturia inaequalis]|uniref:BTB domain-containing protein n=1 Tax=Venturia inaequalis TaxID=5025 RepID=A0A8H3VJU8_VENIN|nr:hypothetical protein EG328_000160 [Venturia inaequalis]
MSSTSPSNSTNTPSNLADCIVTGNADFYGFGIRLGTYFQFCATLLVTLYAPKEEDFYRALNNLLQTAMFAGLIILTRTQNLLVVEPVIVIFLLFGSLSSLTGEGFSPIGRPSGIYRLLLYSGISGYSCWFWFIGIDSVAKRLAPSECNLKTTAFLGQVSPYGGFRTFNKVASVLGLVLCVVLLIWSCMKFLKNGASRNQPRERTTDAVLLFYSFTIIIVSIVGAEWIIRANHMTEIYDVNGVGQIIPLLVGALGMIETLKDVFLSVMRPNPPRRWIFFGRTKGYWAQRWATAFWRQRSLPSSNTSSIAPADSSSTRAMALDDLDKKTPPTIQNSSDDQFNESEHSHLTVRCKDGTEIYVHKNIVCPQSTFFANACKKGRFKEGMEGVVNIEIGESDDIKAMLSYLYMIDPVEDSENVFGRYARLYIAADFYDIATLRTRALQMLKYYAYKDTSHYLRERPGQEDFIATIKYLYESDDNNKKLLRRIFARATAQHSGYLLFNEMELSINPDLRYFSIEEHLQSMLAYPDFARRVATATGKMMRDSKTYRLGFKCTVTSCETEWIVDKDPHDKGQRIRAVCCPHCGTSMNISTGKTVEYQPRPKWD